MRDADRLVVLRQGVIVEQGSYAELLERNGFFAEMLGSQQLTDAEPPPAFDARSEAVPG